jgi:hypothetical protein
MSNVFPSFQLKGCLHLELDQHLIKMECEGQSIKLTFSSFSALKKCLFFTRMLNGKQFPFLIQDYAEHLKLTYYLNDLLIGESRSDLKPSWLGRYIGLEKSKIYPRQFLTYFLRFS